MQPYFFPYIGYWQLINAVDKYVIFDDVNFIKRGWIHKNRILVNGQPCDFILPLIGVSQEKKINEVNVNQDEKLLQKNLLTIERAYKKAPYYNEVYPLIEKILKNKETNVAKYLEYLTKEVCNYLDINTEIIMSSSIDHDDSLRGQDKIIDICQKLNATEYYNAFGGQDLYDYDKFEKLGMKLAFVHARNVEYKQFKNEFQPFLSIIDVMMFNSKDEVKKMLNEFDLITK